VSDINTAAVDGLKALDSDRPIREADIGWRFMLQREASLSSIKTFA
jgi:hypothetical protein